MPGVRFSIVMLSVFKQSVVILNVVALFYFLNEFSSLCFKITESLKAFVKMLDQAGKNLAGNKHSSLLLSESVFHTHT
jgi:hypothetical protein